jgi:hypothetical protein
MKTAPSGPPLQPYLQMRGSWPRGYPSGFAGSVFLGSASGVASNPCWSREDNQAHAHFRCAVAGREDILIGAPGYDGDLIGEGKVSVYQ